MRTTLALDDDVLDAARSIAKERRETIGKVVSELARNSLRPATVATERNGIRLLPIRRADAVVTADIVNALRDEMP